MTNYVLVLNAGSSSLKFCLYGGLPGGDWQMDVRGQVDGIGTAPHFKVRDAGGRTLVDEALAPTVCDDGAALAVLTGWLHGAHAGASLLGVGHRVVHGGSYYVAPVVVTPEVMAGLRALVPLAPLHQPCNLDAIDAVAGSLPGVPQVACFDTSFHRGQPAVAGLLPLPADIRARGVQRYGFHGLSYEYIASVLPAVAPAIASGRVIVAHLGSGASLCALRAGQSIDSTMGFTALDGLCMGTRPGAIDPGAVLYLFQQLGMTASQVEALLYRQSGLLGISGTSNDMRDLLASPEAAAALAVDYFVYRAAKEIGALAAALGGLDALVFTAGIGENSPEIRARIGAASAWLGMAIDPGANGLGGPCISRDGSRVSAWVIPTNEELMIARHTVRLLGLAGAVLDQSPGPTHRSPATLRPAG
jgi:acetate kinase